MIIKNLFQSTVSCKLCGKKISPKNGRLIVHYRQDKTMQSVMFSGAEKAAMTLLNRMGTNLNRLSDIRSDVYLCNDCFNTKLLPAAKAYLSELSLKDILLKGGEHGGKIDWPKINWNIDTMGGVGELGITDALFLFSEMYDIAKQKGIEPIKINSFLYWIFTLSTQYFSDMTLSSEQLTPVHPVLIDYIRDKLEKELRGSPLPHVWNSSLDEIEKLFSMGVPLPVEILKPVDEMASTMEDFLQGKSIKSPSYSWWAKAPINEQKQIAREIITKAQDFHSKIF